MSWFRCEGASITLQLHVQPGAKRTEVSGLHDGALKVRLAAPPVDGKANAVLIAFIAKSFAVPQRSVELLRGELSRQKTLKVTGSSVSPESLLEMLR